MDVQQKTSIKFLKLILRSESNAGISIKEINLLYKKYVPIFMSNIKNILKCYLK